MKRPAVLFGAAMMVVLAVGACSRQSGNSATRVDTAANGSGASAAAAAPEPASGDLAGKAAPRASGTSVVDGTAKIRTADITVAIRGASHVAAKADAAGEIAIRTGGEVDADDRTSGKHASATLQLRVPPAALRAVLSALGGLGHERSRTLSTIDVTEKVADIDSRVTSARQSIARLRLLFTHAQKVGDVIAVESELSSREADLESLEAQQRTLARQTSMAAITVTLVTASRPAAVPPKQAGGFTGGLQRGWDGFVSAAVWLAAAVGTVLPFFVLALLVALAARFTWSRVAPHRPTPGPTPADG